MISDSLECVNSMTEMYEVEEALRILIRKRRTSILMDRKKVCGQVGFVQRQKIRGKIVEQACNGTVKDVKGDYAYIDVVAPIRFTGRLVQIDMALLREPFEIVEKIEQEPEYGDEEESGPGDGNPLPVPLG